ncbi:MAG: archease [Planctomycetaceae bacterium]
MYEIWEHTADLGLRVRADNLNSLFAEAGRALLSVIVHNLEDVRAVDEVKIEIDGTDIDFLFLDWLSELLFAFESRRLLLSEFSVNVDPTGVRATARGESMDPARHQLEHEVKAITYHGLMVRQDDQGWTAEAILDI